MTDIMKLADDYVDKVARGKSGTQEARAALQAAIEALQGEVERLTVERDVNKRMRDLHFAERDALAAELATLKAQEPVAHFGSAYVNENGVHVTTVLGPVAIPQDAKLYAAPKALAPEQVEAAWRAGWAACRDAEYVGQEAEDEAWGMSETCANADWENAAPKALEPMTWQQAEQISDAPNVDEALRNFAEDQTADNAIALVQVIHEATHGIGGQQ